MSNSSLVTYTALSHNNSGQRTQGISKITPHHMAGVLSVETCGSIFAPSSRQASSNYGIGNDGRVGMYVEEHKRAWTSSSNWNDQRAVTIEVSNSVAGGDWLVGTAAWNSLVNLCVDICRRNPGIKRADGRSGLHFTGDKNGSLTMHEMFAATNCPGPYLKAKMTQLANEVNAVLDGGDAPDNNPPSAPADQTPSIAELAAMMKKGDFGNGRATRIANMTARGWGHLYDQVQDYINAEAGVVPSKPATTPSNSESFGGTYRSTVDGLRIRKAPSLNGAITGSMNKGDTRNLDNWYQIANGWVWGRFTTYEGNVRYVAVGRATGKPEVDDYLIKV